MRLTRPACGLPGGLKLIIAFFLASVLEGLPDTFAENLKEACIIDMIK
jgi:hypothetical protein